ncbi:Hypothetical predicted protein [Octopus vulgaris]|uniref:Reverse transcriptase domain-containing protein n=1 Tax=Octopus vulgaris TaxID=6645 RepID=A0AA36FI42_OCTVU|nr:Hypothetical predicted protein [Octopus vulgaris]
MYAEKKGLEDSSIGVRIGGRNINNLRYADDTTLLAASGKDLEDLVLVVKKESEKFGLHLNVKKTKIMSTAATTNISIKIDNEEIEVVDDFIFLGSKINQDGEDNHEVDDGDGGDSNHYDYDNIKYKTTPTTRTTTTNFSMSHTLVHYEILN